MNKIDFNIVTGCGSSNRTIVRYGSIYYVGCRVGGYEEIQEAVLERYDVIGAMNYIAKLEQLRDNTITDSDITADDNFAIKWCSNKGYLDAVKYLVEHGADVTTEDNYALHIASEYGYLGVVKCLIEHGAGVTASNNYAIRWASQNGHLDVVKYLVEHGADVTAKDNYAVRYASQNGHLDIVKYLEQHGAKL